MSAISDALDALLAAVRDVEGLTAASADQVGQQSLPVVVVGAPALTGETFCAGPSTATFAVTLLVRLDSTAMERLFDLAPLVWAAIEDSTDGIVSGAVPVSYDLGQGVTAAAYELTVEYPLT